jgi:uncharacterized protein GlcG (DUF336 family)
MKSVAISLALFACTITTVKAEEQALDTYKLLTPATAIEITQAALKACSDAGYQVAVTVVDRMGVAQAMVRDRFAGPHTPETSVRKAWTAVSFRTDTLSMSDVTKAGSPQAGARFISNALMIGGGVPVTAGGSIVAGVGVSGAPGGAEDDACARAGIAAVQEKLEF